MPTVSVSSPEPFATDDVGGRVAVAPAARRAAMLEHPTLAVAAIEKGRIREINASWHALFALPPNVAVESHVATLFPNVSSADRFERHLQAEIAGRKGDQADGSSLVVRSEHTLMRRDGSAFLCELIVWLSDFADADHALNGDAIWQARDITVERSLRRELRDLEDFHRELSRHQGDMTFVIDKKGRISYATSSIEGALGYRLNTLLGEPFTSLLDPADASAAEQWLRAASRPRAADAGDGLGDGFRLQVLHHDGGRRVLLCRPRNCFNIPRIAGLVVHARDMTESTAAVVEEPTGADRPVAAPVPAPSIDATALRHALSDLTRTPVQSFDLRVEALLEALVSQLGASSASYWQPAGIDGRDRRRHAFVTDRRTVADSKHSSGGVAPPLPPLIGGPDDAAPRVADDVGQLDTLDAEVRAALRSASTAALVEAPVLVDGIALGWLAVAASEPRAWSDGQIDFIVGTALLAALAFATQASGEGPDRAPDAPAEPSGRDRLTGLPDRAEAERFLEARTADGPTAKPALVLVVDLDRLQDVNDAAGNAAGDAVIRRTARILSELVAPDGFVARIGADEFLVVVAASDPGSADAMMRSMIDRIGSAHADEADGADGADVTDPIDGPRIEASIGAARFPSDAADAAILLQRANTAMREAKRRGGAQAFVFDGALAEGVKTRKALDTEIEDALANDEFIIFYQPQLSFASGAVVGLEALLRWQHPVRGILLPDAFMHAAFERGLIDAITKRVLTRVCGQIATWRRAGDLPEIPVAVNVSGRQFHDRRLPALVASALLKSGLPARLLQLEITEQTLAGDDVGIERVVKELSRLGVRIAIGDFSVGHASFKYLRQLQVSQIKLDSGFVRELPGDAASAVVAAAVIDIAKRLKYQVVAEGVETREQFEHLRGIGCEVGQGYYFAAPVPASEVRPYLESQPKARAR